MYAEMRDNGIMEDGMVCGSPGDGKGWDMRRLMLLHPSFPKGYKALCNRTVNNNKQERQLITKTLMTMKLNPNKMITEKQRRQAFIFPS